MIINLQGERLTFTAANTVNSCKLARVYASANTVVTHRNSANTVLGSFTMPGQSVDFIEKDTDDTLEATVSIEATPVGFRY